MMTQPFEFLHSGQALAAKQCAASTGLRGV